MTLKILKWCFNSSIVIINYRMNKPELNVKEAARNFSSVILVGCVRQNAVLIE